VSVLEAADGTLRADNDGRPASFKSVQSYIARMYGHSLPDIRSAIEAMTASLSTEELNHIGWPFGRTCRQSIRTFAKVTIYYSSLEQRFDPPDMDRRRSEADLLKCVWRQVLRRSSRIGRQDGGPV
jgi:hypothetical protein